MKSDNRHLLKTVLIIISIFIAIVILVKFVNYFWPAPDLISSSKASLLRPDTSEQVSQSDILSHNSKIRDFLIQMMSMQNAQNVGHQTAKIQMRGFYLAILAGIIGFILRFKFNHETHSKQNILFILSAAIVLIFFGLEVYEDDLFIRYNMAFHAYSLSVVQLSDLPNVANTWQLYDYDFVSQEMKFASKDGVRWFRMLRRTCQPGVDQIVLYLLPLIALAVVTVRRKNES